MINMPKDENPPKANPENSSTITITSSSTPPLVDSMLLPDGDSDALENSLYRLGDFVDMKDSEAPVVVDPKILMAIIGHSSSADDDTDGAAAARGEDVAQSTEQSAKQPAISDAILLVNGPCSLLGLQTKGDNSINRRFDPSRKRRASREEQGGSHDERTKRAKVPVLSAVLDAPYVKLSSISDHQGESSLVGNTCDGSKQQSDSGKDCENRTRNGRGKATNPSGVIM